MAMVKFAALVDGIRGKVGGFVFSANGAGNYVKELALPVAIQTAPQSIVRARFSRLRHAWGSLSEEQVAAWEALALNPPETDTNPFGEEFLQSGSAWHTRVNLRRLQAGQDYDDDAPASVPVDPPATFGLTVYESAELVEDSVFTYTENDFSGAYAVLAVAVVGSTVRTVQSSGYRVIWCGAVEGATATRINEELVAAFGALFVGQKVFGKLWKQSTTGIRSVALEASTLVLEEV